MRRYARVIENRFRRYAHWFCIERTLYGATQIVGISGLKRELRVVRNCTDATDACWKDHRCSAHHGFDTHQPERLIRGRENGEVRRTIRVLDTLGISDIPDRVRCLR